jgi:Bacterial RNA polymerase, alpha chain C terminal domain
MSDSLQETVTLSQARSLIKCLAHKQSLLLLSPPGVGKSDTVAQAALEADLPCRSLLGTQIAPEDVSGIPRIVGERSVFCPPRVLLPENPAPFCLFLDELPACTPDIQKAFYSLLLERRLGEHRLPEGTWVVAAGNRLEDRALVRSLSSALINRVIILQVRVDVGEWLAWAREHGVRADVVKFIEENPSRLIRPVPSQPLPFSTPRAWTSLAHALDLAEASGLLNHEIRRALAMGRVTREDAEAYCSWVEAGYIRKTRADLPLEERLNLPLAALELSIRATNCLESEGLTTVRDLVLRTGEDLLEIRNFGETTLKEVKSKLEEIGLELGMKLT